MKRLQTFVVVVAALAAACSAAAGDRALPQYPYQGASDPIPGTRPVGAARADPAAHVEPPARASELDDDEAVPPTVSGIALEPTLASACRLPASPKAFFEFDSADLDSRDVEVLRRVAACLTEGPLRGHSIELVGRADPRGATDYNEQLAGARAATVRDFLRRQGVPAANIALRVSPEGLADPLWPPGWSFDRRVDIRLIRP